MAARPKVLVVDDDPDFRASVRALLESREYEVVEASSGSEGLRRLAEERPALIVLDIMMKCDCEGYGVTWTIKSQEQYREFRNTPIVMTSAIGLAPDERFAMCSEAELIRPDYYFAKPLDIPRFLEAVDRAARASAAV